MKTLKNLVSTIVIALIISVSLLLFYLGWTNRLSSEILLPLLAIVGVVCLLAALTFAAVIFAKVGVADKTQALALPEGSVRAVIALSLIVIFAIVSVFLFGGLANGELRRLTVFSRAEAIALKESTARPDSTIEIVFIDPPLETAPEKGGTTSASSKSRTSGSMTSDTATSDVPTSDMTTSDAASSKKRNSQEKETFEVGYRSRVSHDASDFAKQLITLLGTLVTSMAGFYFGSRTATAALNPAGGSPTPTITSVTPSRVSSTAGTIQVAIVGSGLNGTKGVKLSNPAQQAIEGTIVQKSDSAVVCSLPIPTTPGKWDLVITGDGDQVRQAFEVS
jgi:hypothetical protein